MAGGAELAIILTGKDSGASSTMDRIGKAADGIGASLKRAGEQAAGFVIGRGLAELPGFLTGAAKAAADEQKGMVSLQKAVENTGISWERQGGAIESVIAQREKLGFSDDELRKSMTLLTQSTHGVYTAMERQAIAMDLATGTGMDLEQASKLLGRVNSENINVFKRYGIVLADNATEMDVLREVQARFGGQAEAVAKTAAGQWQIFQNQMANLQEDIGSALIPIMTQLGARLIEIVAQIRESGALQVVVDALGQAFGLMGESITLAAQKLGEMLQPGQPAREMLDQMGRTIQDVLVPALTEMTTKLGDELGPILEEMAGTTLAAFVSAAEKLAQLLGGLLQVFSELITELEKRGVFEDILNIWEDLSNAGANLNEVAGNLADAVRGTGGAADEAGRGFDALKVVIGAIGSLISSTINAYEQLVEMLKAISEAAAASEDAINAFLTVLSGFAVPGALRELMSILDSISNFQPPSLTIPVSYAVTGAIPGLGGMLPGFQYGGVVPGPIGAPMPIIAHGGERIETASRLNRGGGGGNVYITVHGSVISEGQLIRRVREGLIQTGKSNAGGILGGLG
jgi:hypothetical protein